MTNINNRVYKIFLEVNIKKRLNKLTNLREKRINKINELKKNKKDKFELKSYMYKEYILGYYFEKKDYEIVISLLNQIEIFNLMIEPLKNAILVTKSLYN